MEKLGVDILTCSFKRRWLIFVEACLLISSRAISQANISRMNSLLIQFCKTFESIYGSSACTPNLHLHCHLHECLVDFGPASAFWLFACERLNGILGSFPTNHHSIEVQLMRKFTVSQQALASLSGTEGNEIAGLLHPFYFHKGSLKHEELNELPPLERLSINNVADIQCALIHPVKEGCLNSDEYEAIDKTLKFFFDGMHVRALRLHKYASAVHLNGELYGSLDSLHSSSALVYARTTSTICDAIPGFVLQYLSVNVLLKDGNGATQQETICFAHIIIWLNEHEHKNWFGASIQVWRKFSQDVGVRAFIPATDILCRCAHVNDTIKFSSVVEENVTVVVPLNHFSGL